MKYTLKIFNVINKVLYSMLLSFKEYSSTMCKYYVNLTKWCLHTSTITSTLLMI